MFSNPVRLKWLPVLLVAGFLPSTLLAQVDQTLISGSTCQARNLTVRNVGVTNLSVHPLGETVQCFDTNTPLLQSAFGLPTFAPAPDRQYQIQPWGVDATWWSDPPSVDVTFPVMGMTIPVSCSN